MRAYFFLSLCLLGCGSGTEDKVTETCPDTGTEQAEQDTADIDDTGEAPPQDNDGDGYSDLVDCDDDNPDIHPGAIDLCDEIDNDCDTLVDEDPERTFWADEDADGYGDPARPLHNCNGYPGYVDNDSDCNDANGSTYPGALEVCDEADNDCNGTADDDGICSICEGTKVLIFARMTADEVAAGAAALGSTVVVVETAEDFLQRVQDWSPDVAIFSSPTDGYTSDISEAITHQIAEARAVIVSHWDFHSNSELTNALQVTPLEELTRPHSIYGLHPDLLSSPNPMSDPWIHDGVEVWEQDGVTWVETEGTQSLATIDSEGSDSHIAWSADQMAIANGFLFDNFKDHDTDADGIKDLSELVGNQVALLTGCTEAD